MRINCWSSIVIGLVIGIHPPTSSAQTCTGCVFTSSADFLPGPHNEEGYSVEPWFNLQDGDGKLDIAPPSSLRALFPYLNVACSGRDTVARMYVGSGDTPETTWPYANERGDRVFRVGEYLTRPAGRSGNPSRTTSDHRGNVWVANRDEPRYPQDVQKGSITRIALVEGGIRCDENGNPDPQGDFLQPDPNHPVHPGEFDYVSVDNWRTTLDRRPPYGLLKTSRGLGHILPWPNTGGADSDGGVTTAEDELITNYVRVDGTNARTMAIDADNDLWVGGYGNRKYQKIDGVTGLPFVPNVGFISSCGSSTNEGAYGGLVDHYGLLWSVERNCNSILRYDPQGASPQTCLSMEGAYGIAIDPLTGHIWVSQWNGDQEVCEIDPWTGQKLNGYEQAFLWGSDAQGVAVDGRGHVWVAEQHGESVLHFAPDPTNEGRYYAVIDPDSQDAYVTGFNSCTGVAVDKHGRIWVSEEGGCQGQEGCVGGCASRIDPDPPDQQEDGFGNKLGVREASTAICLGAGATPYNYSDMTGFVAQQPLWQGRWTVTHDGGVIGGRWGPISWNDAPGESCPQDEALTRFVVRARAADSQELLDAQPYVVIQNGETFCHQEGRYIQVEVNFKGNNSQPSGFLSPVLCNLTIHDGDPNNTGVIYVDKDADGADTGASWTDAFTDLQSALSAAQMQYACHGCPVEIWVAEGTYFPDRDAANPQGTGNRSATFTIGSNIALYGGFAGGETSLEQRDPANNETILSGDLNENDAPDLVNRTDNAYHVVTVLDAGETTVLDGVAVVGGYTEYWHYPSNRYGAGISCLASSPVIRGCIVRDNHFLSVYACYGGGIACDYASGPTLINCLIVGNSTSYQGGGVYVHYGASAEIINCTIAGNVLTESNAQGGGIYSRATSTAVTVKNAIVWGNSDAQIACYETPPTVMYSDVQGGTGQAWFNGTCKDADPAFVAIGNGNYRLVSPGSPCIDAGDNGAVPGGVMTDLDGNDRFVDDTATTDTGAGTPPIVDMGAYEFAPCTAPTATSISPAQGAQGRVLTGVSVGGTGFVPNSTTVTLTRDGESDIVATDVVVASGQSLTCALTLPPDAAVGAWDVVVTTCADSEPLEGQFTVCIAPTITSIDPQTGVQGHSNVRAHPPYDGVPVPTGPIYMTITGTGFSGNPTVILRQTGKPDITATNVSVAYSTAITADISLGGIASNPPPVPGAFDGTWDVMLTTTCGDTTLYGAFTVSTCFDPPQDGDGDGDVDLADFVLFQACFNGPNRPWKTEYVSNQLACACMNAGGDIGGIMDVDLEDFLAFQACFNGPNRPLKSTCGGGAGLRGDGMFASRDLLEGDGLDSFEVTFDLQSPQAGQTISAGTPVEWHAAVGVTGESQGLGGYVFSLFLGPGTGPTPGPDGIWGNGDDQNLASIELATAQWPETFAVPGANGKPTSGAALYATGPYGGPGMDRATSVGYNEKPGTLLQVGNGHLAWAPWRYYPPPLGWRGDNTWGVGLDSRKATLLLDTEGDYEVNAGEIDTTNLSAGHYVLTLVPSEAATVLDPAVDLSVSQPGGLMLYADSVSGPVSIEFDIGEE